MTRTRSLLLLTAILGGGTALIVAQAATLPGTPAIIPELVKFQSHDGHHTDLVELYTSEGCSSCPPADEWLSKMTASPQLWKDVVPVEFHINYWDNSSWRDRFSSPAWTARQKNYDRVWNSSAYTPNIALDGHEWGQWGGSVQDALNLHLGGDNEGTGQLGAVVKGGKAVSVAYRPTARPAAARNVSVAVLGFDLSSRVKGGENSGRSLRHDFVVLACETKKLSAADAESTASFDLPAVTPDSKRLALAIWVEEPGREGVQQATGGWLTETTAP